ncbi:MAG: mandelate racemase/muconate lactonizing enzyme family protein [Rhodospirillaceae bacterium]|nr:mandelate racemase/muconate lactonizing enzyme family protein [Rhodospirillaceae bacterium]
MKIKCISTDHYRIPLPVVLSDSTHGEISAFELVCVRITDTDGVTGSGYTYTVGRGGAAIHALIERDMAPDLIGRDADRIEAIWKLLWWRLHYVGRGGLAAHALSAIDIALWDLKARRLKEPLWRLLGGADPKVKAYAGGIDLYFTLEDLLRQTDGNLEKGFRAIKMKVGRSETCDDVARVSAMRKHLGDGLPLMVDANMGWTVDQAIRAARAFREFDLVWLEEPTIPDDFAGHTRILSEGGVPIAAGENLHSIHEFEHLMAANGVSYPEPDVSNCGGITVWMKVAALAEARGLPVTSHGVHELHVHLLGAVPNASYLEAHGFGLDKYIAEPLAVVDGYATAPEKPGHGVEFDWAAMESVRA